MNQEEKQEGTGKKSDGSRVYSGNGSAIIDGKPGGAMYGVKTTINESRNPMESNVPHSYEVTEIELLPEGNSSKMEPTASGYQGRPAHGIAKILKNVEKSYEPNDPWSQLWGVSM